MTVINFDVKTKTYFPITHFVVEVFMKPNIVIIKEYSILNINWFIC